MAWKYAKGYKGRKRKRSGKKNGVIIQEKHSQPNWETGNLLVFGCFLAGYIEGWYIVSFISAGCSVVCKEDKEGTCLEVQGLTLHLPFPGLGAKIPGAS